MSLPRIEGYSEPVTLLFVTITVFLRVLLRVHSMARRAAQKGAIEQ